MAVGEWVGEGDGDAVPAVSEGDIVAVSVGLIVSLGVNV